MAATLRLLHKKQRCFFWGELIDVDNKSEIGAWPACFVLCRYDAIWQGCRRE